MSRYNHWADEPRSRRRKSTYQRPERKLGTPRQEAWRKRCWALFCAFCDRQGWSRTKGRKWIAQEMDIEERYAIIYEMDEPELITVADLCKIDLEPVEKPAAKPRKKRKARDQAMMPPV